MFAPVRPQGRNSLTDLGLVRGGTSNNAGPGIPRLAFLTQVVDSRISIL